MKTLPICLCHKLHLRPLRVTGEGRLFTGGGTPTTLPLIMVSVSKPSETSGCHKDEEQLSVFTTSDPPQASSSGTECWVLIQQNDGSAGEFFNRTWNSYRDGFGDASGNYWIGNEHLHQMTQLLHDGFQFTVFHNKNHTFDKMGCRYRNVRHVVDVVT